MTPKYLKTLEFDKILARAAEHLTCEDARERLLGEAACATADEERDALARTDAVMTLLIKNGSPRYSNVPDAPDAVRRAVKGGMLSMPELLECAEALRNFRNLALWYQSTEHDALPVDDLFYALSPQPQLEKNIFDSISPEGEMADSASDALFDVRRKIRAAENSIRDKLDAIIKNPNTNKYLQDAVVSLRNGRFVVPVRAEHRGDVGGVIHDVSSSGSTLFVEPTAVVEANARIMQLRSLEREEIERILAAFTGAVAAIEPMFTLSYDAMLSIDVLVAKGQLALDLGAMLPSVRDDCRFKLVRARHPLIDRKKAVPIDVALGFDYDTLIVTGPNTGGKTVTLKTSGLLCAMAQHGYLIPAHESSEVCLFSDILADIGDEQSIEQSLSTFSGHIRNITEIMSAVGPDTLVLMDELGAGTDPAEGAALAVAIIEHLRRAGAKIMATTHYAELKLFALETPGVQNASCEFDVETLRPTYRISIGVPGKSNAFLISERLGLPKEVISLAEAHLSSEDRRFDAILAQLDDLKAQIKAGEEETERLRHGAERELEKARRKRDELIAQGERELAAARDKAQSVVQEVQNSAYDLMDEMRRLEKDSAQSAAQRAARAKEIARKETEKLFAKSDVVHAPVKTFTPLKSVTVGQEVQLALLGKNGIVLAKPDKKGMVEVRAGVIRTKVPLSELCAPQKQQAPKKSAPAPRRSGSPEPGQAARSASLELNLIGMTVEEAIHEADLFIDNALMTGRTTVYLIHGKGTGALRRGLHEHLRKHPSVKSFRLGGYYEGQDGVTIADLV